MSLLLILSKIWRYKLVTLPLIALMLLGAFYVVVVSAPTYEATSTYILVNPPPPPTDEEIARDPSLAHVHDDNPYARFSDQTVLVQILTTRLNSDENRARLVKQGADPNYTTAPSSDFGFSAPILQVDGTGSSAVEAVATTNLVGRALSQELDKMQAVRGVDKGYRITTEAVVGAHDAKLKPSGKARSLVAVMVLGTILLFITISVLDAVSTLIARARERNVTDDRVAESTSVAPPVNLRRHPDDYPERDPDPQWPLEARS
jgi:capsular polysaccharide biosynthesis protein